MNYNLHLKNKLWLKKRNIILYRDNFKCKLCGSGNSLNVHHTQYHFDSVAGRFRYPWEYNDKFLITLCNACHESGHKNYKIKTFKI